MDPQTTEIWSTKLNEKAYLSDSDVILAQKSSSLPLFNMETLPLSEIYFKGVKKKNVMIRVRGITRT